MGQSSLGFFIKFLCTLNFISIAVGICHTYALTALSSKFIEVQGDNTS